MAELEIEGVVTIIDKFLTGFIITEPDMRGSKLKRRKCPEMKRITRRSRFAFRCHVQTIQKRERQRDKERKRSKKVLINNNIKGKKRMVRMHEKYMKMGHATK